MIQPEYQKILTKAEKSTLIQIARDGIAAAAKGEAPPEISLQELSDHLRQQGASFVTLTMNGKLRGCIGALRATQPLALDVQEHAIVAATQDYRFPAVRPDEVSHIEIEISRLSPLAQLDYANPEELVQLLKPGTDGVMMMDGFQRATFLPQVWEKIADPEEFLNQLCVKMGTHPDCWRKRHLDVYIYQVEEFKED